MIHLMILKRTLQSILDKGIMSLTEETLDSI